MNKLIPGLLLFLFSTIYAQKELNVLPLKGPEMLHSYLINQMYTDVHSRDIAWNKAITNITELKKYQVDVRGRYKRLLSKFPTETSLNAQISGTILCKGYSIEKIIYESFQGHHVTANLYIPSSKGKHPAAVFFCGHEETSKATESYQKTAILFAQNGFVILVIDPVSQSERHQLATRSGEQLTQGATTEHTLLNGCSLLVGKNTPSDMLYDNKRGVDYLVTRSEVDTSKIGCLGNSGGGIQTLYFMAFDKRMKVAAPCSYFSIRHRAFEVNNPDDGCQQMPNEGKEMLDLVDYITLFAPKPVLILSGKYDFIYFQGTKEGAAQVQQVYDKLNESDKFKFFVADDGHGISKPKREAVVSFFLKQLCGVSNNIVEPDNQLIQQDSALKCTTTGSINRDYSDEITIPKRNLKLYDQFTESRTAFCRQDTRKIQSTIKILLGFNYNGMIEVERTGLIKRMGYSIQKLIIHSVNQPPLPCLFFIPEKPTRNSEIILFADEKGENKAAKTGNKSDSLAINGQYIVMFDPRGIGETADAVFQNDPKFQNNEYRNAVLSLYNGETLIGQRTIDIIMALDFISSENAIRNRPIHFIAKGSITPAAIHAAILDNRITGLELNGTLNSWKQYLDNPLELNQMSQVIPGVLQYYDLPDLVNILKRTITIEKK
jgi:dienelactone hydrolase